MHRFWTKALPRGFRVGVMVLAWAIGTRAIAQTPAIQWDFNASTTAASINATSGTPTITLIGGTTATFAAPTGSNNANSSDPVQTGSTAYNTTTYPSQGTGSGTAGVVFAMPTTSGSGGFSDLVFRFDQRLSNTASRTYVLEVTTDGMTFVPVQTFFGGPPDGFATHTFDLSGFAAANNNPNFAARVVSVFDPTLSGQYGAANPTSLYGTTGTVRYDMVTLSQALNWQGGVAGGDIANSGNYVGGVAPGATSTMAFGASVNTTVNVATSATYGQMLFRAGSPGYTVTAGASQTLTLNTGIVNLSTATQTFTAPVAFNQAATVQNNGVVRFDGTITLPTTQGLQVTGTGTTIINGNYNGGDISVMNGATLAGIGTLFNEVHVWSGTIRGGIPGDPTHEYGTLTLNMTSGDLELYAAPDGRGSRFQIAVNRTGVNTVQNSKIALVGGGSVDLELNDAGVGANKLIFEILANNLVLGETYTMTIVTTDSLGSIEFNNAPSPDGFIFPITSYELSSTGYTFIDTILSVQDVAGGSTLVLTFTPVPEPGTVLGLAAAGLGMARVIRRWRRA
jgi:hypothetical protein